MAPRVQRARRKRSAKPQMEGLETRIAPTVNIDFVPVVLDKTGKFLVPYAQNPSGFFLTHPQALADLQTAGRIIGSRLNNQLAAIPKPTAPGDSWTASFLNPTNALGGMSSFKNIAIPQNTIVIYVSGGSYA